MIVLWRCHHASCHETAWSYCGRGCNYFSVIKHYDRSVEVPLCFFFTTLLVFVLWRCHYAFCHKASWSFCGGVIFSVIKCHGVINTGYKKNINEMVRYVGVYIRYLRIMLGICMNRRHHPLSGVTYAVTIA